MEELLELKQLLQQGEISSALTVVEELEEMGRKAIERNIRSYIKILLLHLIKKQIEQRTTKSWEVSIRNAAREIKDINSRPKGRGNYLTDEDLVEIIHSCILPAIEKATLEIAEGVYSLEEIKCELSQEMLIYDALIHLGITKSDTSRYALD